MIRYTLPCIVLLASLSAHGQIAFGGQPIGMKAKAALPEPAQVTLPAVDVEALMQEDAQRAAEGIKGPYRFGFNHATDLSLENSGTWYTLPNGDRVWRIAIACPEAYSINFEFHDYVIPEGAKVFVYNDMGDVLGAFTAESNGGYTSMGVTQLAGDRITIEYVEPLAVRGQGRLQIGQVTHAYRDIMGLAKGLGDSGSCNNNVICPEGDPWRDQIRSVAMITVGGSGLCTGTLINNCAQDGTPFFLTANHCLGGNVSNWVFRFNWESPVCNANQNGPTNQTVSGCTQLANSAASDVALLRLNSTPPASYNVYYSGWDRSGTPPTSSVGIHHPSGDIKKITFDNQAATQANFGGAQCWRIANWEDGTTEPGSSGSGLWNQDKRLIGQLYGGQASCQNNVNDYYGRFNVSYTNVLQAHLGNCGNTLDGYDPNNSATYQYDAGIESINNVPAQLCNQNTVTPSITIKNNGTATLTSLNIAYTVSGGGPSGNANWSGSLATGASTNHTLPTLTLPNGSVTLTVTASQPNGQTDENPANNSRQQNVSVASPGINVTFNLTLDNYGSETTWTLTTAGGATLASGGPYSDGQNGTLVPVQFCLAEGCYNLTVNDSYGDGICCQYGQGHFEVVGPSGNVLASNNGNFSSSTTANFCVSATSINELSGGILSISPNPSTGRLVVELPADLQGAGTLTLYDAVGRAVMRQNYAQATGRVELDLSPHADGTYLLEAISHGARSMQRVVLSR
jgi:lysyl endopeptidase